MFELWYVSILDGQHEIDHLFIDADESLEDVIKYILWFAYKEKNWDFAEDVKEDDPVVLDFTQDDDGGVSIYCTNHIPDIIIEKHTTFVINMDGGEHGLNNIIRREKQPEK